MTFKAARAGHDRSTRVLAELYQAVVLLASHPGPIEARLAEAYFSHLKPMDVSSLAPHAQVLFEWIRTQLNNMFPRPDSIVGVDRTNAILVAQSIILLHFSLKSR